MQTLKSTYTGLVTLCLLGLLSQAAGAQTPERGVIESPSAFVSGIGFISGWKCNSNDIELWLTGADREGVLTLDPAQNMPRSDTAGVCLGEENNGWIIQVNWNELIGYDRVVARDNGEAFDSADFTIGHTGLPFIHDKEDTEVEVVDFPSPGKATTLTWSTATQHFEVSGTEDITPCTGDACEGSGEGTGSRAGRGEGAVICEPAFNIEDQSHGRTITCESRDDLQSIDYSPVNWVLDDDGCYSPSGSSYYQRSVPSRAYHRFAGVTVERDDHTQLIPVDLDDPDRDANWYFVRRWYLYYRRDGADAADPYLWKVTLPRYDHILIVPVPHDEPGNWNQHKFYSREIPFDDRASYHLQHVPSGIHVTGPELFESYTATYVQYQFYALGPEAAGEGAPCFREIPQAPAP